jgi:hypothetical protein
MNRRAFAYIAFACAALPLALPLKLQAAKVGNVVGWGNQVPPPTDANAGYVAVAGGVTHTVAVKNDGTVIA